MSGAGLLKYCALLMVGMAGCMFLPVAPTPPISPPSEPAQIDPAQTDPAQTNPAQTDPGAAPPPESPRAAPQPWPTAPQPEAPAPLPPQYVPQVSALAALPGLLLDDPRVVACLGPLGAGSSELQGGKPYLAYPSVGIGLELSGPPPWRIVAVELLGRKGRAPAYPGALPEGLRFSMPRQAVQTLLGEPVLEYGTDGDTYRLRALKLHYTGNLELRSVRLLVPLRPAEAVLDDLTVATRNVMFGERGVELVGLLSLGARSKAQRLTLSVLQRSGVPVKVASAPGPDFKAGDEVRIVQRLPPARQQRVRFWVPYRVLALPAAWHDLVLRLRVEEGRDARSSSVLTQHEVLAQVSMPRSWRFRILVSEVAVEPTNNFARGTAAVLTLGLSTLLAPPRLSPQLTWYVTAPGSQGHLAQKQPRGYRATWQKPSDWIRLCDGEHLDISVGTERLTGSEVFGRFQLTPQELAEAIRSHRTLRGGKVLELVLSGSQVDE